MSVSGTMIMLPKKWVPAADTPPPSEIRPHAAAAAFSAGPTSDPILIMKVNDGDILHHGAEFEFFKASVFLKLSKFYREANICYLVLRLLIID